jgi:signal transduction histidine kinase
VSQVVAGQRIGSSIPAPSSQKVTRRLFGRGGQLPVSFRFTMREFVWLVALAAFALLLYWFQAWDGPIPSDYGEMAILVVLAIAAQHFPLTLTPQYKIDISIGVYFTCLLLFGPLAAMILVGVSQLLGQATLGLRRHPASGRPLRSARQLVFNTSQLMIATGLGGLVYYNLLPEWAPAPLNWRENLWAIPAATATIYLASGLLVATMVGLQRNQSPWAVWLSAWRLDALESAGLFLIGLVTAMSSAHYSLAPVIMVFPAAGIYLSLRRNLSLVEQATAAMEAERRRANQAEHLAATLARVGAADDLQDALEALLRGAITLLGGEQGVAHVFGPQSGEYTSVELVVDGEGRLGKPNFRRLQTGLRVAEAGEAPAPDDGADDVEPLALGSVAGGVTQGGIGAAAAATSQEATAFGSSIGVPVKAAGRRIGSIQVTHRQPGLFGSTDLALARALAAQAGAAIERTRLEAARREAVAARQEALVKLARQSEELTKREAEAAALLEVDRLKNEFLSTVSHELRTPLTVIDGYAQWLEAQAHSMDTRAVQSTADRISAASAQLVRLIQDILDFARLQRGEVLVQSTDLDLSPILGEVRAGVMRQIGGDRVTWDIPVSLPAYADGARIVQVVSNLIENAIKYAPDSAIAVRAVQRGGSILVEVEDHGPGIPAEEQSRVWEKFYRAQHVVQLNLARGTGIGLAVVKALVEAQGGRVGLRSTPGVGTCFWFELPVAREIGEAPVSLPDSSLPDSSAAPVAVSASSASSAGSAGAASTLS